MIEIPSYNIKGEIGQGGMASVYLAVQTSLDREVALKVMSPALAADPAFTRRFLQEARMLASLAHPNIVQVFDVGVTNTQLHYFSMQYLANGDFISRVQRGLAESELKRVLNGIANALGYAHQRGYVHRDVAPGNILFDANDNPVLTDFGIALAATQGTRITSTGFSVGTSHYMSPEQARGGDIDSRSDLYSLGVLTWYGLTGKPPYDGADGFAVAYAHVFEPVPQLPPEQAHWQPLIDKALAKDPKDRYADVGQFIAALDSISTRGGNSGAQTVVMAAPRPLTPKPAAKPPLEKAPPPSPAPAPAPATVVPKPAPKPVPPTAAPSQRVEALKAPPAKPVGEKKSNAGLIAGIAIAALLAVAGGAYVLWPHAATKKPVVPAVTTTPTPTITTTPPPPVTPPTTTPTATDTPPVVAANPPESGDATPPAATEGDATALVLSDLPTVLDPVQELVRLGRGDLAAQRYTTPPGVNALERFRLALRIDAKDKNAKQGIVDTAKAYLALADKARAANDMAGMNQQWAKAAEIANLQLPEAKPVLDEIAQRRAGLATPLIEKGNKAAADWDKATAKAAYDEALSLDPENAAAKDGLKKLAAIGAPGFVFRDKIAGAAAGPEVIVLGGGAVAVGRYEVTRGEFRRYWAAEGARAFGSKEPSCRDRESFFRGSKKRNWQNPDITQDDSHPVVCVSWDEAAGFARWLSQATGQRYRLLGNAEWDQLAKATGAANCGVANLADADFSKAYDGKGAACSDGFAATAPVGHYPAAGGVFDIDGNVREWVNACGNGATASATCRDHRFRGRSWISVGDKEQAGFADNFNGDVAANSVGFRIARDVDQK